MMVRSGLSPYSCLLMSNYILTPNVTMYCNIVGKIMEFYCLRYFYCFKLCDWQRNHFVKILAHHNSQTIVFQNSSGDSVSLLSHVTGLNIKPETPQVFLFLLNHQGCRKQLKNWVGKY